MNLDKVLKKSTPEKNRLHLTNWAGPNRRDIVRKDPNYCFSDVFTALVVVVVVVVSGYAPYWCIPTLPPQKSTLSGVHLSVHDFMFTILFNTIPEKRLKGFAWFFQMTKYGHLSKWVILTRKTQKRFRVEQLSKNQYPCLFTTWRMTRYISYCRFAREVTAAMLAV